MFTVFQPEVWHLNTPASTVPSVCPLCLQGKKYIDILILLRFISFPLLWTSQLTDESERHKRASGSNHQSYNGQLASWSPFVRIFTQDIWTFCARTYHILSIVRDLLLAQVQSSTYGKFKLCSFQSSSLIRVLDLVQRRETDYVTVWSPCPSTLNLLILTT